MTQNTSSAVMAQRKEPHDSLDDFPTPPWATRALCEWLMGQGIPLDELDVREPAANRGHMAKPLYEYFDCVHASDVHDYGAGYPIEDYLWGADPVPVAWTITNPPFRLASQFVHRALRTSRQGVAMILRTAFLESVSRYWELFDPFPPRAVLQFTERVVMHKGRLSEKGSTATAYCWVVWDTACVPNMTEFHWIPPCRKALERPEDYQ